MEAVAELISGNSWVTLDSLVAFGACCCSSCGTHFLMLVFLLFPPVLPHLIPLVGITNVSSIAWKLDSTRHCFSLYGRLPYQSVRYSHGGVRLWGWLAEMSISSFHLCPFFRTSCNPRRTWSIECWPSHNRRMPLSPFCHSRNRWRVVVLGEGLFDLIVALLSLLFHSRCNPTPYSSHVLWLWQLNAWESLRT